MSTIPITSLKPDAPPPSDTSIRGVVTLSWPYSSSTRQCALLLSDPDFRLRSRQGQVRVRFTGASAEAVAKSRVGIGDEVLLALNGAKWEEDSEATRTPGKSVDGELLFRRKLQLKVARDGGDVTIDVDAPASPPGSVNEGGDGVFTTPLPKAVRRLQSSVHGTIESPSKYAYTSPAFAKRLKLSDDSFLDSAFDPFAGDSIDVNDEEEGRRVSFGRDVKWKYAAKTPSPPMGASSKEEMQEQDSPSRNQRLSPETGQEDKESTDKMPPPPLPRLELPQTNVPSTSVPAASTGVGEGPSTPNLRPVQSSTLPLPSPFPTEGSTQKQLGLPSAGATSDVQDQPSTLEPGSSQDDEAVFHASAVAPSSSNLRYDPSTHTSTNQTQEISQPETPTAPTESSGFGFGFDGAAFSVPTQQKVSPQEAEKERVMANTYRSLFGFGASKPLEPQAEKLEEVSNSFEEAMSEMARDRIAAASENRNEPPQQVGDAAIEQVAAPRVDEDLPTEPQPIGKETEMTQKPLDQTEKVEVIEIESTSEEESDEVEEESPEPPSSPTRGRSQLVASGTKSPEIPDTYQDSQAEDLMVSQRREHELSSKESSPASPSALRPERTEDSILEAFIEEDKLYPTLPPTDPSVATSREIEVETTSPDGGQTELDQSQTLEMQTNERGQTLQQPSFPSLPITPSNSQSLLDKASQAALEMPETLTNLFPPTPQLTQAGSSVTQLEDMAQVEASASQEQPLGESRQPQVEEPTASQNSRHEISQAEQPREEETRPSETGQPEAPAQQTEQIDAGRMTRAQAKKARASRLSNIPDAISSYFSPKRFSLAQDAAENATVTPTDPSEPFANGHAITRTKQLQPVQSSFSTPTSYFTPLSRIENLLNPSSQQAYGSQNTIDVFAVVTDSTTEPARAKKGPRDHYTIFRITDSSLERNQSVRVEVFRPYKNSLPIAKVGDAILLRAFTVKSKDGKPYLISGDASGWCVFQEAQNFNGAGGRKKPAWVFKAGEENAGKGFTEEMKGPPVEFGDEEREHAKELRLWWQQLHGQDREDDVDGHDENEDMAGMNGHMDQPVAASL